MWQARLWKVLPIVEENYPTARWVFLTLTVRNCPVTKLRTTLQLMGLAWHRLVKRPEFSGNVIGWIRSTEVTRGCDGSAHPHFHCLLMVRPSYFGKGYVKQERWTELWRQCARLSYTPIVDVRAVKARHGDGEPLQGAVAETLKYTVKPDDLVADREWLLELTAQVHKLRFINSGGFLKDVIRELEEFEDDLIFFDEEGEGGEPELFFEWNRRIRRYVRSKDPSPPLPT
jgi:plasmid rolling circle replication initiator protein Rep